MRLPDLLTDWWPPVGLSVEIGRPNASEKLVEGVRRGHRRLDDKTALFDVDLNLSVLLKADLESESLRNS